MPDINTFCSNPSCRHPLIVHDVLDPGALHPCRVTRCVCEGFAPPSDEPVEPDPDARRLVIEIPEGFAVTVQLVPVEVADSDPYEQRANDAHDDWVAAEREGATS